MNAAYASDEEVLTVVPGGLIPPGGHGTCCFRSDDELRLGEQHWQPRIWHREFEVNGMLAVGPDFGDLLKQWLARRLGVRSQMPIQRVHHIGGTDALAIGLNLLADVFAIMVNPRLSRPR